jgi:hypothetical protein
MRAALLALSACSYAFVTPPADPPQPPGDCTTSFVAPGLDLLGAIAGGAATLLGGALYVAGSNGNKQDSGAVAGGGIVIGVPGLVAMIAYGFSTGYGHRAVDNCQKRRRAEIRDSAPGR